MVEKKRKKILDFSTEYAMMYETIKENRMKKRSFSIKKDLGRKVRYVAINAIGAVKPNIYNGQIIHIYECDREWCTLFNAAKKKAFDVHVSQLV